MASLTAQRTDPAVWVLLAGLLVFLVPLAFFGAWMGFGMTGFRMGTFAGFPWGALGFAAAVALILVAILLVARAIQMTPRPAAMPAYPPPPTPPPSPADARRILDERYARGEISREEYLRMRADLEGRT